MQECVLIFYNAVARGYTRFTRLLYLSNSEGMSFSLLNFVCSLNSHL